MLRVEHGMAAADVTSLVVLNSPRSKLITFYSWLVLKVLMLLKEFSMSIFLDFPMKYEQRFFTPPPMSNNNSQHWRYHLILTRFILHLQTQGSLWAFWPLTSACSRKLHISRQAWCGGWVQPTLEFIAEGEWSIPACSHEFFICNESRPLWWRQLSVLADTVHWLYFTAVTGWAFFYVC